MSQKRIEADDFKARHRQTNTAFTRVRSLPFALVLVKKCETITKRW